MKNSPAIAFAGFDSVWFCTIKMNSGMVPQQGTCLPPHRNTQGKILPQDSQGSMVSRGVSAQVPFSPERVSRLPPEHHKLSLLAVSCTKSGKDKNTNKCFVFWQKRCCSALHVNLYYRRQKRCTAMHVRAYRSSPVHQCSNVSLRRAPF